MKSYIGTYCLLLGACLALTGCGVATGVGATVGVASAQEGGLPAAATDLKIQTQINSLWFQSNVDMFRKLDLTVEQGRVLITGVVQDPQHRVEAVRLAWQPNGVKQVINEIRVAESDGFPGYARDTWITTRLRGKIILEQSVQSINYTIDTVQGVVYLMGIAQSQAELNKVIDIARNVSGVKQVVSYVKFAGQPLTEAELQARDAFENGGQPAGLSSQSNYSTAPALPPQSAGDVRYETRTYTVPEGSVSPQNALPPPGSFPAQGGNTVPTVKAQTLNN